MNDGLKSYMEEKRKEINDALNRFLPSEDAPPQTLHRAMKYSVFAGGKRLRPILCLACCEAFAPADEAATRAACALEYIHTYSLIHDDLPAMDDDDTRRGLPTNHVKFGEGIAILAGDALLNLAFEVLAWPEADAATGEIMRSVTAEIGRAAGAGGMVGGQCADLEAEGQKPTREIIEFIHTNKTARMIAASLAAGALCGRADRKAVERIREIGLDLGLAFQITDDVLDIEGDKETLGKTAGKDANVQKATYPALVGIDESKKEREAILDRVVSDFEALLGTGSSRLNHLAKLMVIRQY
ncbi:polyprenyl synthetase family protein [Acidobacteriota bacterium]